MGRRKGCSLSRSWWVRGRIGLGIDGILCDNTYIYTLNLLKIQNDSTVDITHLSTVYC